MSQVVQMVITLTPDGQVKLDGPLENKILCFGLLEVAKMSVAAYEPAAASRIVRPTVVPNIAGRG